MPSEDRIQMPPFEFFRDPESYYATLLPETVHWTKHPKRLDREFGRKRWGDEGYAMEELVAEIGSVFLSADLRITPDIRDDHASYLHDLQPPQPEPEALIEDHPERRLARSGPHPS